MAAGLPRTARRLGTLLLTAACVAYILWKIDIRETLRVLAHANLAYFVAAAAITILAVLPMSWRWQQLLAARGVDDSFGWLTRTNYVSYAAAQVLPTSLGGDATRIYTTARRHRSAASEVTGSVLLERALGGVATLSLAAVGFLLAVGRYDVGAYLWLEAALTVATIAGAAVIFSRRLRRPLAALVPLLRFSKLERPLRAAYEGLHGYRDHTELLAGMFALTLFVQVFRVLAIWLVGRAVGVDLPPRPYFVFGPLLFVVMLVPFTINGIALREAFFVSFLGKLHVPADAAFATGFLFFLLSVVTGIPGALILASGGALANPPKDIDRRIRN
jgi:glycosyltransferase 2 family protein